MRLVRPLAEQGDANAQYNLGVFYDNGLGVPQDKVSAYTWLSLSAAQGRDGAAAFRDLIARRMTSAQIAEAQKRAREWKPNKAVAFSLETCDGRPRWPNRFLIRQRRQAAWRSRSYFS